MSSKDHFEPSPTSDLDDNFCDYPLLATPRGKSSSRHGESNCFSPFLMPTPNQTSTPGMCTSWGGEDAKLLQETFSKGYTICSTSSRKSCATHTPRVCFKDQLPEIVDHNHDNDGVGYENKNTKEETPFTNSSTTTPGRRKSHVGLVTGSGRERTRANASAVDDGDNLLSTAFLATPRSPKMGSIQDIDQSLHHIDAYSMIKSPVHFGSPIMKQVARSPLRL